MKPRFEFEHDDQQLPNASWLAGNAHTLACFNLEDASHQEVQANDDQDEEAEIMI